MFFKNRNIATKNTCIVSNSNNGNINIKKFYTKSSQEEYNKSDLSNRLKEPKDYEIKDIMHNPYDFIVLKSNISMWRERWSLSSNAKDIGTLYLIFSLFSGLLGTAFSVLIRLELSGPGVQYVADNQLYNSIITAHAIVMIFFMVDRRTLFSPDNFFIFIL